MSITPEQQEQCRTEFESWWIATGEKIGLRDDATGYCPIGTDCAWKGFKVAWRPRLTVEQIRAVLWDHIDGGDGCNPTGMDEAAAALFGAMGGKDA